MHLNRTGHVRRHARLSTWNCLQARLRTIDSVTGYLARAAEYEQTREPVLIVRHVGIVPAMARAPVVRFAVVDPVTGRHSGIWRIWTHGPDVYVAPEDLGGMLKVSLHPGVYRVAYTYEYWRSGQVPNNAPGPGRQLVSYQPSKTVAGVEHAWLVAFQPDALLDITPVRNDAVRIMAPDSDHIVQVDVWICAASVQQRPRDPIDPSPLELSDGRHVWVGHDTYPAAAEAGHVTGRRDYPTAIVEFADRKRADGAPGFVLRPAEVT